MGSALFMREMLGLRHVLMYLRMWWRADASAASDAATTNSDASAAPAAATAAPPGGATDKSTVSEEDSYKGPRQVLLLPLLPPPGSISGLNHPWPPTTTGGLHAHGCGKGNAGVCLLDDLAGLQE